MAALFDVARRASEAVNEKVAETLLRSSEIASGIHWTEDVVVRNAPVECRHQTVEAFFADR